MDRRGPKSSQEPKLSHESGPSRIVRNMGLPTFVVAMVVFLMFMVGMGIGALIGHFTAKPHCHTNICPPPTTGTGKTTGIPASSNAVPRENIRTPANENKTFIAEVLEQVDAENIRQHLRVFAGKPHLAGLQRDEELVEYIKQQWLIDGLDSVELVPYNVLLSYPNPAEPNKVSLLNEEGSVVHQISHIENIIIPEDNSDSIPSYAFNAYAPNGSVTGELVYANYGTVEDFQLLANLSIDLTNTICLVRDGQLFRGNKVANAYERGAIGVIFYTDPGRVSPHGIDLSNVYPNTIMLPPSSMQWGAVFTDIGDPLTPHWPSIEGAYRVTESQAQLPRIPSQPISYQDAEYLLQILGGKKTSPDWSGYSNLPYQIGPGFNEENNNLRVRLDVNNQLKRVTVYNVIGKLSGSIEPDRYVIEGNHRDAWGYGASDPSSGTAQLMETVRVFGKLSKKGWRPRRSLIFASWAAEEYGVIGSQEWVEENVNKLMNRAVGYINTDICVSGPNLEITASPSLMKMVFRATKMVDSPSFPDSSVYERWRSTFPSGTNEDDMIVAVGSGSDVAPFAFYAGVPVADIWFRIDHQKYNMRMYPAYHTDYDTLYMMEKFVDADFKIHRACSQLALVMMLDMADSVLVPLDHTDLAKAMDNAMKFLDENQVIKQLELFELSLYYLDEAVRNFTVAVRDWNKRLSQMDLTDPLIVRSLNDQLLQVEKSLILPGGLPGRPNSRHVLFSPSTFDAYSSSAFSGITDLVQALSKGGISDEDQANMLDDLERHITEVMVQIRQAASALQPV